jgi:hypothetical protein
MSQHDIMHEHDNQRDAWPPLPGTFAGWKTHSYVAIIEGFNHSLEKIPRDHKEITLFRQWKDISQETKGTIPTSGEISSLIIAFL